jgi:hypothetical protein
MVLAAGAAVLLNAVLRLVRRGGIRRADIEPSIRPKRHDFLRQ